MLVFPFTDHFQNLGSQTRRKSDCPMHEILSGERACPPSRFCLWTPLSPSYERFPASLPISTLVDAPLCKPKNPDAVQAAAGIHEQKCHSTAHHCLPARQVCVAERCRSEWLMHRDLPNADTGLSHKIHVCVQHMPTRGQGIGFPSYSISLKQCGNKLWRWRTASN